MSQKAVKGSAIADFLASRALEDYEPLNFDFSYEEIVYVAAAEEENTKGHCWKLNFDGASNAVEYEACNVALRAAIERKIKSLEVYGDFALVIYQLRVEEFDDITFNYLLRDENQMADALATLASMIKDILRYVRNREYPDQATENDKRTLRRLAYGYVLDGEILYKRRKDQVLPREFNEGDLVLKKILPIQKDFRGKWMSNWEGPYVVKKAFFGGALVNSDAVKKYYT
ncbi:uncharacterized protein [Gossypium hirsutum]|uniref:RNase H type-1 domain-containing protein n=1 Tax=Gossypium hirsutum TaxID=3635 RepID=A0A1U8PDG7_GOSHI|nr:uncharacterized protein LOC107958087 [Gossypium hirsutum]